MESCCGVAPLTLKAAGPECGAEGKPVSHKTLLNMLVDKRKGDVNNGNYYFCATLGCPAIYYDSHGSTTFFKGDIKIRVGLKETDPPIPVCYCFNITKEDIRDEIRKTGRSTASQRIRSEIKATGCSCEINNPSGRCCLGDVERIEKQLTQKAEIKI